MNKPPRSTPPAGIEADHGPAQPAPEKARRTPEEPPRKFDETPDEAAAGRDRLRENEDRPMDPGVSDSAHS